MNLSRQAALVVMVVLLALLVFGTQMPGAWRDEVFRVTQLPWQMTKVAHFVLFAGMAGLSRLSPLRWSVLRVVLSSLALALLSEYLQNFASNRDPSWTDVGIDMAGVAVGLLLTMHLGGAGDGRHNQISSTESGSD